MYKICIKCEIEKEINEFGKRPGSPDGYRNDCKNCRSLYMKTYKEKNKEKILAKNKTYYENNKEKTEERGKKYREKNKEKLRIKGRNYHNSNKEEINKRRRENRKRNKEKIALRAKKYYENNKEKENLRKYKWHENKIKIDPSYKLKCRLRSLILISIKNLGYTKKQLRLKKSEQILGCKIEEFKFYIEGKFSEGMNWENHGKWHIDHIIPISYAKNEEEVINLNHYTNFQPLWAIDNYKKGNKYIG
jgi:hypothetical protein